MGKAAGAVRAGEGPWGVSLFAAAAAVSAAWSPAAHLVSSLPDNPLVEGEAALPRIGRGPVCRLWSECWCGACQACRPCWIGLYRRRGGRLRRRKGKWRVCNRQVVRSPVRVAGVRISVHRDGLGPGGRGETPDLDGSWVYYGSRATGGGLPLWACRRRGLDSAGTWWRLGRWCRVRM